MSITIQPEQAEHHEAIRRVINLAFEGKPYSNGTESVIVEVLRKTGKLFASLIALRDDKVVGHLAISPILVDGKEVNWFALGPVSVLPDDQGQGIGSSLVKRALQVLEENQAQGCVELGNPTFYSRFGFERDDNLVYQGAPAEFFQRVIVAGPAISGNVSFDSAFEAKRPDADK